MNIEYPIRLQSYISKSTSYSRRKAEDLIKNGCVRVNGTLVTQLGTKVEKDDKVMVLGEIVKINNLSCVYMLNKPVGYLSSLKDEHFDKLAVDLINTPDRPYIFNVGRLDLDTSGLLLFTNDGIFANKVMHPREEIEKEYVVETNKQIKKSDLTIMRDGVIITGDKYRIKDFKNFSQKVASVTLTEGKNREIRKLFGYFDYEIKSLCRVRIGRLWLGDLGIGRWKKIPLSLAENLILKRRSK